jgi:hypothetical protein
MKPKYSYMLSEDLKSMNLMQFEFVAKKSRELMKYAKTILTYFTKPTMKMFTKQYF